MSYKSDKLCESCYNQELYGDDEGGFFVCMNCGKIQQPTFNTGRIIIVEFWAEHRPYTAFGLETVDMKEARKLGQILKKKLKYPRSYKARYFRAKSVKGFMWKHHRPAF